MAAALLNCSICPNQPTFSDTSHLLTHVSSKGHLSNLHKLQVRSHQELSAGHQLAAYNQWYQQHNIGGLLSDRMLQKESKKATKRRRTATSPQKAKKERKRAVSYVPFGDLPLAVDPRLQQTPSTRPMRRSKRIIGSVLQSDHENNDLYSSPTKQRTKRRVRRNFPSSIKRSSSDAGFEILGHDRHAEIDPAILDSPDNNKLKGVLWPGMHLFDAATVEMRRRRNQKKDGSTLMQMEKTSKQVQPTEVIYSEGWTSIKQRPITGMVEDSSPLKGESPLPKKPVRRKRSALAEISTNFLGNAGKSIKLEQRQADHRRRSLTSLKDQGFPSRPSSSNGTSFVAKSLYSPTEDETIEFKLTVGNLVNKKKGGNFTIFHEKGNSNPYQLPSGTAGQRETIRPQFATAQMQSHLSQSRPQGPFTAPSWLQPHHQQTQTFEGRHLRVGPSNSSYFAHQYLGTSKENVDSWFGRTGQGEQRTNALSWNHNSAVTQPPYSAYDAFSCDGEIGFSGLPMQDDMFGYSANPLTAAYQTLQDISESPFKTSEVASLLGNPFEKGSISPGRTLSERSEQDHDQSAYATTE